MTSPPSRKVQSAADAHGFSSASSISRRGVRSMCARLRSPRSFSPHAREVAMSKIVGLGLLCAALLGQGTAVRDGAKPPMVWEGSAMTTFEVKDVAAAKKWYGEMLGCTLVYELADMGWCEVSTPVEHALIGLSQVEAGKTPSGSGGAALSFGVKNIEASRSWLAERGVKVAEIFEIPSVVKLLHFTDPDGNRLLLYQPAEH
jgi:predicted enzyme related to lactoylglutathione lyase